MCNEQMNYAMIQNKEEGQKSDKISNKKFKEKEPKNLLVHHNLKTDHVGGTK